LTLEEKKKRTRTISFGSPTRESYDASCFYTSRLHEGFLESDQTPYVEDTILVEYINTIHQQSSEQMSQLPENPTT
jgi:hypothetical protein